MMDGASVNQTNIPQQGASEVTFSPDDNVLHMHNGLPGSNHVREYFYARQRFGTVLSFRPQVNGAALANFAGAKVVMTGYGPDGPIYAEIDSNELKDAKTTGGGEINNDAEKIFDGRRTTTLGTVIPTTQPNLASLVIEGVNMLARSKYFANTAELVVLGDPLIKPMRNVLIIVMTYRKKKNGRIVPRIHYTSGIWGISEVRHIIQNGEFITNLTLYRNDKLTPEGLKEASELYKNAFVDPSGTDGIQDQPPPDETQAPSETAQANAGLQNNYPTNDVLR
jgi:hypothetical protein